MKVHSVLCVLSCIVLVLSVRGELTACIFTHTHENEAAASPTYYVRILSPNYSEHTRQEELEIRCGHGHSGGLSGSLGITFKSGGRYFRYDRKGTFVAMFDETEPADMDTSFLTGVQNSPRNRPAQEDFIRKLIQATTLVVEFAGQNQRQRYNLVGSTKALAPIVSQCLPKAVEDQSVVSDP